MSINTWEAVNTWTSDAVTTHVVALDVVWTVNSAISYTQPGAGISGDILLSVIPFSDMEFSDAGSITGSIIVSLSISSDIEYDMFAGILPTVLTQSGSIDPT